MFKKRFIALALILLSVLAIGMYLVSRSQFTQSQSLNTAIPPTQADEAIPLSTVVAERTALAMFTQNPILALSSTPSYAEIIYHEVIRNLTEIPLPNRPCYLSLTDVPANPTTPIAKCGPLIATIALGGEGRKLMALMQANGLEGTVGIESTGLEQIDEAGVVPFVPIQSRLGFALTIETVNDRPLLISLVSEFVDFLVDNWGQMDYVSTTAEVMIEVNANDGSRSILTTYLALAEAHQIGLDGEALIEAIGGLSESGEG